MQTVSLFVEQKPTDTEFPHPVCVCVCIDGHCAGADGGQRSTLAVIIQVLSTLVFFETGDQWTTN